MPKRCKTPAPIPAPSPPVAAPALALLTVAETAARLSLSTRTVARLVSGGTIKGKKYGRSTRIIAASVDAFITSLPDIDGADALFPERRP